ncbi:MAG: hypothetical protein IPK19_00285 [Chloroflexi bacterium]|nr:hypothetical protein [Chloroflexota bacterium]
MTDHRGLDERVSQLSNVLTQVLASQEVERRTLTYTLREEIGQSLTALAINLRILEQQNGLPLNSELIGDMRKLTTSALHELDRLQRRLYPPALESQGLIQACEVYIQEFARTHQVRVEMDAEVPLRRLPTEVEITLFRIIQDVMEHVREQRCASEVRLRLRFVKEFAYLVIEIDSIAEIEGWRTTLMVERAEASGGRCAVMALPLAGARFEIALPVGMRENT